jgi:hypothetical protein
MGAEAKFYHAINAMRRLENDLKDVLKKDEYDDINIKEIGETQNNITLLREISHEVLQSACQVRDYIEEKKIPEYDKNNLIKKSKEILLKTEKHELGIKNDGYGKRIYHAFTYLGETEKNPHGYYGEPTEENLKKAKILFNRIAFSDLEKTLSSGRHAEKKNRAKKHGEGIQR